MALDFTFSGDISQAIRDLMLCRVKLRESASATDTEITVSGSDSIPANRFFLNYTTACRLVQPTSADTPSGVLHYENVTIDEAATYTNGDGTTIGFTSAITKAYDTNAYIRPVTLPSVSSGLKFIDSDFIPSLNWEPKAEWFPGVLLVRMSQRNQLTNAAGKYRFEYHFRAYYCDILRNDRNNADTLWEKGEALAALIEEDNYLGGTVNESHVIDLIPWYSTDIAQRGARFFTDITNGIEVGWVQFDIRCDKYAVWPKHSITE